MTSIIFKKCYGFFLESFSKKIRILYVGSVVNDRDGNLITQMLVIRSNVGSLLCDVTFLQKRRPMKATVNGVTLESSN